MGRQRDATRAASMTAMTPLPSLASEAVASLSDLVMVIPFVFGGKEAVVTDMDTPSSRLPYSLRVIYL